LWGKEDFRFVEKAEPSEAAASVVELACKTLPWKLKLDPISQIQVLSPMRKGSVGVESLNAALRERLNPARPDRPELKYGFSSFRRGDKVMQTSNNYEKLVWNGDLGIVTFVDLDEVEMCVSFPEADGDRIIKYALSELDQLELAFCISIHKSQGSEYPAVVMPIMVQHFMMLRRNLLYTGITRAKSYAAIVGTKKALAIAIRNVNVAERRTRLAHRLREGNPD
jgi:exodeoxyribonuclease V alpha subunit